MPTTPDLSRRLYDGGPSPPANVSIHCAGRAAIPLLLKKGSGASREDQSQKHGIVQLFQEGWGFVPSRFDYC
jgi:hypothetical protein